jgi:transcriptional regulator with XRE-family HTH domain
VLNAADITGRLSRSLSLARHQRGISQDTLAEMGRARGMRIRRNEVRRWEHGEIRISERNLLALIGLLGHDISWWYAEHDDELANHDINHSAVA